MAMTVAAFALLGLAVSVPLLASIWPTRTTAAESVSPALLVAFCHPRLVFGMALNVALISVALLRPKWTQELTA